MKRNLAPEAKTAGAGAVGALVTFVLLLNGWQHWFPAPPADIVAAGTAILSTAAAYVLPHTHLRPDPGEPAVLIKSTLSDAERRRAENMRLSLAPNTPSFYPFGDGGSVTPAMTNARNDTGQPEAVVQPPADFDEALAEARRIGRYEGLIEHDEATRAAAAPAVQPPAVTTTGGVS